MTVHDHEGTLLNGITPEANNLFECALESRVYAIAAAT
jgi:hypothetical protein